MIFSSNLNKAIRGCLHQGIPFAVWRKPNSTEIRFCANPSRTDASAEPTFAVNLWHSDTLIQLREELNLQQTLAYLSDHVGAANALATFDCVATDMVDYLQKVKGLIETLKHRGGKTVISRTTIGNAVGVDWCEVAERYFEKFGHAFAYLYYMPETGAWLGASPELLLSHNKATGQVSTMSLAGTRRVSATEQPWDEKNIKEQQLVTDFIVNTLKSNGLNVNVGEVTTLNYGAIEHLCTHISATMPEDLTFLDLANKLSPTPALAGYPRENALAEIAQIEHHGRRCYGGYIYVNDAAKTEAFVNLRCVSFDNNQWCIYSGGGITADSDPASEWLETEAKASALLSLITTCTL
jgi:isochorismate synthase